MSQRILVMIRGHLGDLVTCLPALRELRRARPRARITVLVNEYVKDALAESPYIDEIIPAFAYEPHGRLGRARQKVSMALKVLGRHDVFLGFRYSPRFAPLIGQLAGATVRVGYSQPQPYGRLLTHDLGPQPEGLSNRVLNLRVVEAAVGMQGSPSYSPVDWLSAPVKVSTTRLLSDVGVSSRFAVLQISCNWGCNEWRNDKWAALAAALKRDHGLDLVVTGTDDPSERAKFEEVSRLSSAPLISLHGRTRIPELFEVVRRASLVVATDSALTQIALAQRTPAVILFGIEPLGPNGPLPDEQGRLMEAVQHWEGPALAPPVNPRCVLEGYGAPASYCHGANCRENSSLARTEVSEVVERVRRLLGAKGRAASEA